MICGLEDDLVEGDKCWQSESSLVDYFFFPGTRDSIEGELVATEATTT